MLCVQELKHCGGGGVSAAASSTSKSMSSSSGPNFILRRALPYVGRTPSREWLEEAASDLDSDYERRSTLPDDDFTPKQPFGTQQQQQQHKTVIYFGDTAPRKKREDNEDKTEDNNRIPRRKSQVIELSGVEGSDSNRVEIESEPKSDFVMSVSPCREDVLRIEQEQDSKLDDYWSLPGDTTGFRADWSFVQQWRLRGPNGGSRELYCPSYAKEGTNGFSKGSPIQHMVAERDTDSQQQQLRRASSSGGECSATNGGNSSSDENRSSGHASMSDTGGHTSSGSPPRHHSGTPNRNSSLLSVPEDHNPSTTRLPPPLPSSSNRTSHQTPSSRKHQNQRTSNKLQLACGSGSGLEDVRAAIQQLTMRSHTSLSTYSSLSGSESSTTNAPATKNANDQKSHHTQARLVRHSSLETVNTNVTSADEFVWVDSHSRLVELQQLPWTHHDVLRVLQNGRTQQYMHLVGMDSVPRLSYLMQRALARVAREAQRLARPLGLCSKHHVFSAFKIVLCPALADSCTKACLRAAAMFAVSSCGESLKQSKSSRSGLQMPVGRFLRWMSDVRLGRMVHEYAAVYLAAGMENLLEEIVLHCLQHQQIPNGSSSSALTNRNGSSNGINGSSGNSGAVASPQSKQQQQQLTLTASHLEQAIANSQDLWGLLQPYAHLNAGRLASGALAMPRWASVSSLGSANSSRNNNGSPSATGISNGSRDGLATICSPGLEAALLTTCVGSQKELGDLVAKVTQAGKCLLGLSPKALAALFYYMRCSQLEHGERGAGIQELAYERAYVVLPPLVEWLRVASAHAEHRQAQLVDHDDIAQAARLLLPGVDCPVRPICSDEVILTGLSKRPTDDSVDCVRRLSLEMGLRLLQSGRPELIAQAQPLLPSPSKIDTSNEHGLTALMLSCIANDEYAVRALLDAGADPNAETPPYSGGIHLGQDGGVNNRLSNGSNSRAAMCRSPCGFVNGSGGGKGHNSSIGSSGTPQSSTGPTGLFAETQHWTALTYAALLGHCGIARLLLERGAIVEGGARPSDDKPTVTPLQAASAAGNCEMIALLLAHGAQPFLSTLIKDTFCYSGSAQRGCYSAISVAAAHGQRSCLHQLLSHPLNFSSRRGGEKEVLSLEEILAEGNSSSSSSSSNNSASVKSSVSSAMAQKQHQQTDTRAANHQRDIGNSGSSAGGGSSGGSVASNEPVFSKAQNKALQEAMYHSAESNHLDITMELRGLRVPWTLHCWMHSLSTAHEMRIDTVIDQLLQDFLQVCPDEYSTQFVQECLPLLFNIFRYSKKEGTTLLLADIFCTCFGWEPIKPIRDTTVSSGSRIDPKFVNNPELSDVQFRVEGRVFYGHKIVLVTSSPRFKNMLSSKLCEGNPPIIQINDIRYHIFQLVMEFLYHGGSASLEVNQNDVLELMAAANFFQLDGLLRFCEAQCSTMVDLDNIVSMYIHAKVYNAQHLLEYCQGFLLQNMVALMTYDDSVKRLLFAKKLPNHDVLAGLLLTLQARIKARRLQNSK
ncbi:hypothetical protein QAD02_011051 [Eretmocerus hayati]|uniref:Uncharacterized protein n=1 Tax=Eretmocerus hayati TaxID=131215 RepID=A0ACC2NVG9_9HYME|nr:hypothetical protein QAD02_011051 [Eretmocerus hayati]